MQISKITQPMSMKSATMFKSEPIKQPETTNTNEIKTPDNYGRAMVNFKAGTMPRVLSKQDKALIESLSDTLDLSRDKVLKLRQEFKTFLSENNYSSLNDVNFNNDKDFFEECEFIGNLTDRISKRMKLNESQEDALNLELVKRMDEKEGYIPGGKAYLKEMSNMEAFLTENANRHFAN